MSLANRLDRLERIARPVVGDAAADRLMRRADEIRAELAKRLDGMRVRLAAFPRDRDTMSVAERFATAQTAEELQVSRRELRALGYGS